MSIANQLLARVNRIPIGRRAVRVGRDQLFPDSPDRYLAALLWRFGWLEARERALITSVVTEGMVAVDVGANIGVHTLAIARRVGPSGRVYALEPEPRNFAALCRAVEAAELAQVRLQCAAAGEVAGPISLHVSTTNRGDHRIVPCGEVREAIEVPVLVLDELLRDEACVDFFKLDVQGAEALVLRGLRQTLARSPKALVLCELCPALLAQAGVARAEFFAPLGEAGLAPHQIGRDARLEPVSESRAWELAERAGFANLAWRRPA